MIDSFAPAHFGLSACPSISLDSHSAGLTRLHFAFSPFGLPVYLIAFPRILTSFVNPPI
jgi:hypothetical protein